MSDITYFWQGGRKIPVRKDTSSITLQAEDEAAARETATRAGVRLHGVKLTGANLVRATVKPEEREDTVSKLRAANTVVYHIYRGVLDDVDASDNALPVSESVAHAPTTTTSTAAAAAAAAAAEEQSPLSSSSESSEYLITETFFVKFKEGARRADVNKFIKDRALVVVQDIGNRTLLLKVTNESGGSAVRVANEAVERASDLVEFAEPNLIRKLQKCFIPADDRFASQWHLYAPASDGSQLLAGADISAPAAWDITLGKREIVVCVADDGFDMTHPDFNGPDKVVGTYNAVINPRPTTTKPRISWNADVTPQNDDYHGTPCLGVALAEANGNGVVGVAPGCGLLAVRFPLGEFTDADFVEMFRLISKQADVMSCSWGYPPGNFPMSTALANAITDVTTNGGRRGKGLVVCVAAGNNNCPVKDPNTQKAVYKYFDGNRILRSYKGPVDRWIAAHPNVMTISASTSIKKRAAYSSWGVNISVCAPSDNWDDLERELTPGLVGRGITTTDNERWGQGFTRGSIFTDQFGGTSSATPTVAGVCGLVLSANPSLTARDVRNVIESTTDKDMDFKSEVPVNSKGEFDNAGFSLWFGHGKVNAARAVSVASELTTHPPPPLVLAQTTPLSIPDAGAAVTSQVSTDKAAAIKDVVVRVNITHTYIGDLRVDLITPDNRAVSLHNHLGGSTKNINKAYDTKTVPALTGLVGMRVTGTWSLKIQDTAAIDVGQLDSWTLEFVLRK